MSPILPYISRVKPKPKLGGFSCSPRDFMSSFWTEEENRNEREISTMGTEQELSPEQPIPHQQDPSTADCWGRTIWNSTETSMSTRKYRLSPLHWCILYLHTHHFFYGLHFFFFTPRMGRKIEYMNQKRSHGKNDSAFNVKDGFDILISTSEMK